LTQIAVMDKSLVGRKRTRLSREARREQLIKCAIDACADTGIARVTHKDVADLAGVSIPTVFVYFGTRQVLIDSILREMTRFLGTCIETQGRDQINPREELFDLMLWFITHVKENPNHIRVWLDWSTSVRDCLWPQYLAFKKQVIGYAEGVIKRGQKNNKISPNVDAKDSARMIVGSSHMITMMLFSGVGEERVRGFIGHLVESALQLNSNSPADSPADA